MALNDSETLQLFQTIIDNLPSGVSLMNRDLRLVAWNAQIKRLLDFPDGPFAPDPPDLERLLPYDAQRGEYGPGDPEELVRAGLERARKMLPHAFERTRPDGTVLEIRGVPQPVAILVAERVRPAFAEVAIDAGTPRSGFAASIGIASFAAGADNVRQLPSIADQELYEAKNRGRNRVHCVQEAGSGAGP